MTYRNRARVRTAKNVMLRFNEEELRDLMFLVDEQGGGAPAEVCREEILKLARAKRHEMNPMSLRRIDRNAFGTPLTA